MSNQLNRGRRAIFTRGLQLLLSVCVADFKMSGPKKNLAEGWRLMRAHIDLEEPAPAHLYLGCEHSFKTWPAEEGALPIKSNAYGTREYLRTAVAKYEELVFSETGKKPTLKPVPTPFLEDSHKDAPQARPACDGPGIECPWCKFTFPAKSFAPFGAACGAGGNS